MVRPLEIAVDLRAQKSAGERVVRIASDTGCPTTLDGSDRGAGVRTIVRTRPTHSAGVAVSENRGAHGRARSRTGRRSTSKRYAPRRRRATLPRGLCNTFLLIELPNTRSRSRKWRADPVASRAIDARQCGRDGVCICLTLTVKALLSLHLDTRTRT